MSHAGSWRAACRVQLSSPSFRFGHREAARSVTDPGVGSGALLGRFFIPNDLTQTVNQSEHDIIGDI
jgi:hypothetical protein